MSGWGSILGQEFCVSLLRRNLRNENIPGAYLFAGPEGVGKKLCAFEFAKALICEKNKDEACLTCPGCLKAASGTHPDIHVISPQGSLDTIKIDDVRNLIGRLSLKPFMARFQVAIIDGAHCLTEEAANSILKALEEPSVSAKFILISSKKSACLPTIISRCQVIRFQALLPLAVEEILKRDDLCDSKLAAEISITCEGSLSNAATLVSEGLEREKISNQLLSFDRLAWMQWAFPTEKTELSRWISCSIDYLRDLACICVGADSLARNSNLKDIQTNLVDSDMCIEYVWRMLWLKDALDTLVSPRMVGAMFREEWMSLLDKSSRAVA
jgi:DNA polymerase III delta' subunit